MRVGKSIVGIVLTLGVAASVWALKHKRGFEEDEDEDGGKFPNSWFMAQRTFPEKSLDPQLRLQSLNEAKSFMAANFAGGPQWRPLGPTNIGGRVTDIQGSPLRPQMVLAGTASGGVFRSDDAGVTWTPIFDGVGSLSVGAMAIDPRDPDIIWVGTGEANSSGTTYPGTGIYRSADGGRTWQQKGLEASQHIGRIVIDPTAPNSVYVAVLGSLFTPSEERGVYHSADGGSTWELVLHTSATAGAVDIAIDPAHPNVLLAAFWDRLHLPDRLIAGGVGSGIYKSTDSGVTWRRLTAGLPQGPNTGRIGISISASQPNIAYAIFDSTQTNFDGVYKTTDAGETWQRTSDSALSGIYATYGWWFGNIRVDPSNPNNVFALGFTAFRSTDGGRSWRSIAGMHADNHALYVSPTNPDLVYEGNDGGLYKSIDNGRNFVRSGKLPITEFYSVAFDVAHPERIFGGAQDNGTVRTQTGGMTDWEEVNGGDGFQVIVDPVDPHYVYSESQYGALGRSTDGGANFDDIKPDAPRANWNTPIVLDPNDHHAIYYGGDRVYRSTNQGTSWQAISPDLTVNQGSSGPELLDALVAGTITTIAVAKADSKVIYAGTDNGKVWQTKNGGTSWTLVNAGVPQRWITSLAVDPRSAAHVYVSVSGYRSGERMPHVLSSEDFGATWRDVSAGLPSVPVNVVRLDPDQPETIYVGADVGVYVSHDAGGTWTTLGQGLPAVPVLDLGLDRIGHRVVAATFGRSLFALGM